MAGKPQPFKRTRRSTWRSTWTRGPKSQRRLFLYEMARTNNVVAAIAHARITWATYTEWMETGFLSQDELSRVEAVFKSKHPNVDIIVKHTDQELEDMGVAVATTGTVVEATGYSEMDILGADGWINTEDWEDEW